MNYPDPSICAAASVSSGSVAPFSGIGNAGQRVQFINPAGSGAFDYSLDGGTTWHLRPVSGAANGYTETQQLSGKILASNILIRQNASANVSGLVVDLFF